MFIFRLHLELWKCCFCLHYYRPRLYIRISEKMHQCESLCDVMLVRRHWKYVWFTKFRKFWGDVKTGPSLGISKNKKSYQLQAPWSPTRGCDQGLCPCLCPWTTLGAPPKTPERSPAPNLPPHDWFSLFTILQNISTGCKFHILDPYCYYLELTVIYY